MADIAEGAAAVGQTKENPSPTVGVTLAELFVAKLSFDQLSPDPVEGTPSAEGTKFEVTVEVSVSDTHEQAAVFLQAHIVPDPTKQPYDIHVTVVGGFAAPGLARDQLAEFCKQVAPSLLFPYVREAVSRVSSSGRQGQVLLPPINIRAVLNQNPWKEPETATSRRPHP